MQSPVHHNAPPGLRAWLENATPAHEPAVRDVTIHGVRCIIKRRRPSLVRGLSYMLRYIRALLLGILSRCLFGEFARPSILLRNGLEQEAQRLRVLLQAGCRVPEIWWQEPGLLVLEHVGEDMAELMRHHTDTATRLQLARSVATDLAAFHRRGRWHGGAQIRNVTLRQGVLWRIDFEENIGATLSLPLAQVYDIFQMLSSLVSLREIPDDLAPLLGKGTLDAYFAANPDPVLRVKLQRMARFVCAGADLLRPLCTHLRWRDLQAFFRVATILQPLLAKS
jgi:tRNA A-37 threonylcarbamoyl transferase component Bud32